MAQRKKLAAAAADKASSELYNRVVDAVQRTIEKRGVTPKQLARAEKSLDRQMCARAEAEKALLRAECLWYASRLDLEMAKVKRGEAKLGVRQASSAEAQSVRTDALGVDAMLTSACV